MAELYASMPDNTGGQGLGNISKTQRSYFNFLKKQNFAKGDYLELGPDIGLFSRNVINHGGFEKYYFIEPNRAVHPQLKKVLGNKTAFISTDIFNLESIPNNSLSLVVLIHVLDHLIQPKEMIEAINQKMVKGGIILIVTHDEKSLLTKILKKKWPPFCLQHPQLFNVKTTKKLLSNCGFGEIKSKKTLNYFSVTHLFSHALWAIGLRKIKIKEIGWFSVPVFLGNILTVAKKLRLPH